MGDIIHGQTRQDGAVVDRMQRSFILYWEKRFVHWMAGRLPRWVMPDHLTLLGMLATVGITLSYQMSAVSRHWLWLASLGLVIQWFGDSMDGTLARHRKIERPKYGFYVDHMTDMVATILIGVGLGLSPYMHLVTGMSIVVMYLLLGINIFVESQVTGAFRLGYGNFGPTEGRMLIIALNVLMWLGVNTTHVIGGLTVTLLDIIGMGGVVLMFVLFMLRFRQNLIELAAGERINIAKKF